MCGDAIIPLRWNGRVQADALWFWSSDVSFVSGGSMSCPAALRHRCQRPERDQGLDAYVDRNVPQTVAPVRGANGDEDG